MNIHQLSEVSVVLAFFVGARKNDFAMLQKDDLIAQVKEVDGVRHQDPSLVFKRAGEHIFEYLFLHICIKSRNGVIHENNVFIGIDGPSQGDTGLLTTTQVDAFFSDFSLVAAWKYF
jgi:hypothetical protein